MIVVEVVTNTMGRDDDFVFRYVAGQPDLPEHIRRNGHDDEI